MSGSIPHFSRLAARAWQGAARSARRIAATRTPEVAILIAAALARAWRLPYHSFWFDEAVSLYWAELSPGTIWRDTFSLIRDKHPPGYYLLLHSWQTVLGWVGLAENDAALRLLGVAAGALLVWGALRLATMLDGRPTGLTAALFTALAPVLVWYSQELRMFLPAAAGVTWGAIFLVAAQRREGIARLLCWLGFTGSLLFSLYSYLFAAFFLPGLGLSLLLLARRSGRFETRYFLEGCLALLVVAALFLPLARNAWTVTGEESTPGAPFAEFLPTLWRQLQVFTVWHTGWPGAFRSAAVLFFGLLVVCGLAAPLKGGGGTRYLLWLWIGGPLLVGSALLAKNAAIYREDRYFLFLAPFVLWAAARGVRALGQWRPSVGWCGGAAGAALLAASLPVLWTPALYREQWRATAEYITAYREQSRHSVASVLVHPYFMLPAFEWYMRPDEEWEAIPVFGNFGGQVSPETVDGLVSPQVDRIEAAVGADTLWLVQSHLAGVDDQRLVQKWMDAHFPVITEQYPAGVELRGYGVRYRYPTLPQLAESAVQPAAEIFPGAQLAACEIVTPVVAARDFVYHPPSGWVHLRLWLRAMQAIESAPAIFALVQSGDGQVWGRSLERAGDVLAVYPPTMWRRDEFVRVEMDVNLNPLAPPGIYSVKAEAEGETGVVCGSVQIE